MFTASLTLAPGDTEQRTVYSVNDVVLPELHMEPRGRGAKKQNPDYFDAICCLDTETGKKVRQQLVGDETLQIVEGVWIYQWAMGINDTLIAGRTADELITLLAMLIDRYQIGYMRRMVLWIHNAAFDLSFLLPALWKTFDHDVELFATGQRRPIRVTVKKGLEIRCSYKLVNKSLDAWCKDAAPIRHKKLVGAIDYNVLRTPWTELTQTDWDYMLNDVCCQQDCLRVTLADEKLRTVPMTSTGFVRRAMRAASKTDTRWKSKLRNNLPTARQYKLLNTAFAGGYTHCNSLSMGIWPDVLGVDAASMYPACLATEPMPSGRWYWRRIWKYDDLYQQVWKDNECTVARITFERLRLRDFADWKPYIPYSKNCGACTSPEDVTLDNGKVIYCKRFSIALCDLDMRIIFDQYTWDRMVIHECMTCRREPMPDWFLDGMRQWYEDKVLLSSGAPDESEEEKITRIRRRNESKSRLNAIYGMTATSWSHDVYAYDFDLQEWKVPENKHELEDLEEVIEKMRKPWSSAFLRYDWGLYTTAWARTHLWKAMACCGHPLYCDTDSVKGDEWDMAKLEEYNRELRAKSDAAGFTICDRQGNPHPIGVFEPDGDYKRFSALHAKCYAYETRDGKLHCTIAGVTSSNGYPVGDPRRITKEDELGSLEQLVDGKVFEACGGTRAVYIDHEHDVWVDGQCIHSYGGCAILDTTYEIGGVNDLLAMYALSDPDNPYK